MDKKHIQELNLEDYERGKLHKVWFDVVTDSMGRPISIPLLIGRGRKDGPVLGITAAIHGNELNGIPVIQRLFKEIGDDQVSGTVLGVPVVNVPGFTQQNRRYVDGVDLNHIMPGKSKGTVSQVFAHNFFHNIVTQFDYMLDLHTASEGRVNSYYIRADMEEEVTRDLALLQNAQIIVHNPPSDGTLRGAAEELDIPAITLEVGNPNTFQRGMIRSGITGLNNAMVFLGMLEGEIEKPTTPPVICKSSYWIYTECGGLLTIPVQVGERVQKGQHIASQTDIFGDKIRDYKAPESGIVIGKSTSPVNLTGGRILHLGIERR
ncbi:MAG: succinylglutamate desuccinylase/aspartoacylase family protein [Bacteroidia bacterium]|nr:succinylglutamate desuccinylase/aspartoacylase family protein [Bacteroidia bacterium]